MNPESLTKYENPEAEIDGKIEALKESHPYITKEAYWDALKRAKISYEKLKEIVALIQVTEIGDYDYGDQGKLKERRKARLELADQILDCKEELWPETKLLVGSMDDASYIYLPTDRPAFDGESNPIFGAEKLGIPELLPFALVLPEADWLKVYPEVEKFDDEGEKICTEGGGINIGNRYFNDESIFSAIGLSILNGGNKHSQILQLARHESVHAVDFLRNSRSGEDRIITELIAYRIDGKKAVRSANSKGTNPLDLFFQKYLEAYSEEWGVDFDLVKETAQDLKRALADAEKIFNFKEITQLLLNSESVDEFVQAVNVAGQYLASQNIK